MKRKEETIRVRVTVRLRQKLQAIADAKDYAYLSDFLEAKFHEIVDAYEKDHPGCFADLPSKAPDPTAVARAADADADAIREVRARHKKDAKG